MEEQEPSPEYIKAFNNGYMLSKHEPELLNKTLSSKNEQSKYFNAMKAGSKQHELEKIRQATQRGKDQSKERER